MDGLTDTQRMLLALIDGPKGLAGILNDCAKICQNKRNAGGPTFWFPAAKALESCARKPSIKKASE